MNNQKENEMKTLAQVMSENPTLTQYGMGVYNTKLRGDAYKADLEVNRVKLVERAHMVDWCAKWIQENMSPIQGINPRSHSYGYKHLAEKFAPGGWVANGEFIAAALMVGYKIKVFGPNARFNMSQRSVKAVRKVIDAPGFVRTPHAIV